jgi:hypothetical protein
MKKLNWFAVALLMALFIVSLFKDNFTPDYRNTPSALFLSPAYLNTSRLATLFSHPIFWLLALLYTASFIIIPTAIIRANFRQNGLTRFTLWLHIGLAGLLYLAIFINNPSVDTIFVSKINRYLHSPIITLFLWAAFSLNKSTPQTHD